MGSDTLQKIYFEREQYDRSYVPFNCWRKASIEFLKYIWFFLRRQPHTGIHRLMKAHRELLKGRSRSGPPFWLRWIVEKCIRWEFHGEIRGRRHISLNREVSQDDVKRLCTRAFVLKAPRFCNGRVLEKGALLLAFTDHFRRFASCIDMDSFLQHYALILEPSWSGYANSNILLFTRFKKHPIIVMATEKGDYRFLKNIRSNLIPASFGCSDWVNPSIFRPLEGVEKIYDAVMIARWAPYKRHHVLFRALRHIKDPSFKVALVADPWPPRREEIEQLIRDYGITDNICMYQDLSPEEVNEIFNQSKVNLVLSLQEGSNRCLFEGFFAGVPGLALKKNIGIRKDYFTPQTGKLIDEEDLASELLYFRDHWNEFNPRMWAEANIAPEVTTAKLNEILKELAFRRREEWTKDIVAKCNCPWLSYYPDESVAKELPTTRDLLMNYAGSKEIQSIINMETGC